MTKTKLGLTTLVMENSPIWVPTLCPKICCDYYGQTRHVYAQMSIFNESIISFSFYFSNGQINNSITTSNYSNFVAMPRALNYYNFKYCSCNFTTKVPLILVKFSPTIVSKIISSLGVTRNLLVLAIFKTSSLGIFPFTKFYPPLKPFFLAMAYDGKKDLWKYQLPNVLVMRL